MNNEKAYDIFFMIVKLIISIPFLGICFFWWKFHNYEECRAQDMLWDPTQKRCRDDCYAIKEGYGCVEFSPKIAEEYNRYKECRYEGKKIADCTTPQLDVALSELCYEHGGLYFPEERFCEFDFSIEECFKLGEDFRYPKICGDKNNPQLQENNP